MVSVDLNYNEVAEGAGSLPMCYRDPTPPPGSCQQVGIPMPSPRARSRFPGCGWAEALGCRPKLSPCPAHRCPAIPIGCWLSNRTRRISLRFRRERRKEERRTLAVAPAQCVGVAVAGCGSGTEREVLGLPAGGARELWKPGSRLAPRRCPKSELRLWVSPSLKHLLRDPVPLHGCLSTVRSKERKPWSNILARLLPSGMVAGEMWS